MSTTKVRKTVTLDPDVVDALDVDPEGLSSVINAILRAEVERRARRSALEGLLDRLAAERGPVDPAEVEELRGLLR